MPSKGIEECLKLLPTIHTHKTTKTTRKAKPNPKSPPIPRRGSKNNSPKSNKSNSPKVKKRSPIRHLLLSLKNIKKSSSPSPKAEKPVKKRRRATPPLDRSVTIRRIKISDSPTQAKRKVKKQRSCSCGKDNVPEAWKKRLRPRPLKSLILPCYVIGCERHGYANQSSSTDSSRDLDLYTSSMGVSVNPEMFLPEAVLNQSDAHFLNLRGDEPNNNN